MTVKKSFSTLSDGQIRWNQRRGISSFPNVRNVLNFKCSTLGSREWECFLATAVAKTDLEFAKQRFGRHHVGQIQQLGCEGKTYGSLVNYIKAQKGLVTLYIVDGNL